MRDLRNKIRSLLDDARGGAGKIPDQAPDQAESAGVELHQIARKAPGKVEQPRAKPERILKLLD